jgi:hypothetical protein
MFDFVLMSFSMMEHVWAPAPSSGSTYAPNNPDDGEDDLFVVPDNAQPVEYSVTIAQRMMGFSLGAAITMFGVLYYVNEAGKQRHRLQALEMTTAQVPSMAGLAEFTI